MSYPYSITQILVKYGLKTAYVSPGSRNAALSTAFNCNPDIRDEVVPDERSSAFMALGASLMEESPVALCCTSGTAVLNMYPAVAEAFYQKVPLIVLSADRPPEWVDQGDGQTIRQEDVLRNHVKGSFSLSADVTSHNALEENEQIVNQACSLALSDPKGPVHINIPFREPFYELAAQHTPSDVVYDPKILNSNRNATDFEKDLAQYSRVMFVVGQSIENLDIPEDKGYVVVAEPLSNSHDNSPILNDLIFKNLPETLSPELVISCGNAILSKNMKLALRSHNCEHWHFGDTDNPPQVFEKPVKSFLGRENALIQLLPQLASEFSDDWNEAQLTAKAHLQGKLSAMPYGEMKACWTINQALDSSHYVHWGNSMPVRYMNTLGMVNGAKSLGNRGTSGIDGSLSTAVGAALAEPSQTHVAILGDMSFLYDRNALWIQHIPMNLRIVVLNNAGGGIFRMINGPSQLEQLESHFVAKHDRTALHMSNEADLTYLSASNDKELLTGIDSLFSATRPTLLEVFTDGATNTKLYKDLVSTFSLEQ